MSDSDMNELLATAARDMEEVQNDIIHGMDGVESKFSDPDDLIQKYSAAISTLFSSDVEVLEAASEMVALADGTTIGVLSLMAKSPKTMNYMTSVIFSAGLGLALRLWDIHIEEPQ